MTVSIMMKLPTWRLTSPRSAKAFVAHDRHRKLLLAINTHSQITVWEKWRDAINLAAQYGIDAVELSDPTLLLYAAAQNLHLRLHDIEHDAALNCEPSISSIGICRVLLPRVSTIAQVAQIAANTSVELQAVDFGERCAIVDDSNARAGKRQHCGGEFRGNGVNLDLCRRRGSRK